MALPSSESRLRPWIERLEAAKGVMDRLTEEKADLDLVRALKDGSYDEADLDRLYGLVKPPLRAAVVLGTAVSKTEGRFSLIEALREDPFCRALDLLARSEHRSNDEEELPVIELLSTDADDGWLGRKDAVRIGLVRRLVRDEGPERIEAMARRVLDEGTFRFPRLNTEELERLLRLASWIEQADSAPIFGFMDQDGRRGATRLQRAGVASFE